MTTSRVVERSEGGRATRTRSRPGRVDALACAGLRMLGRSRTCRDRARVAPRSERRGEENARRRSPGAVDRTRNAERAERNFRARHAFGKSFDRATVVSGVNRTGRTRESIGTPSHAPITLGFEAFERARRPTWRAFGVLTRAFDGHCWTPRRDAAARARLPPSGRRRGPHGDALDRALAARSGPGARRPAPRGVPPASHHRAPHRARGDGRARGVRDDRARGSPGDLGAARRPRVRAPPARRPGHADGGDVPDLRRRPRAPRERRGRRGRPPPHPPVAARQPRRLGR